MPKLRTDPLRKCFRCGASEGTRITRLIEQPIYWSANTELHFKNSAAWRKPVKVVMHQNGLCAFCDMPTKEPRPRMGLIHVPREKALP